MGSLASFALLISWSTQVLPWSVDTLANRRVTGGAGDVPFEVDLHLHAGLGRRLGGVDGGGLPRATAVARAADQDAAGSVLVGRVGLEDVVDGAVRALLELRPDVLGRCVAHGAVPGV